MKDIKIFLASSNDMIKFRNITEEVVKELNSSIATHYNVQLQLFRWEKNVTPQLGRPQEIIFDQSNFNDIDIFVGILGNRFGTPTGAKQDGGSEYESGTQEEYDMACKLFQREGRPKILVFKNNAPLKQGTFDVEQYIKVQEFIKEFEIGRSHPGIYSQFKTTHEFEVNLRVALTKNILSIIEKAKTNYTDASYFSDDYQKYGYRRMFISQTNNLRSVSKNASLMSSKSIDLLAKTGNSFIGSIGNRYFDTLIQNIHQNNSQIRLLLVNPWSISALLSAFSESESKDRYLDLLLHQKPSQDIITEYIKTRWYQMKLQDVLTNYEQIKKQHPNIELRFIDVEISASMLLTDTAGYFEPYANYCQSERLKKKVSTFEVEISNDSEFYQVAKQHFELLWSTAISYDHFIQDQELYKTRLSNNLDVLYKDGTHYYIGAHAIIRNKDKILLLHRSKDKAYMPDKWDVPGGSLEAGETPIDAVIREIFEETGLSVKIKDLKHIYSNFSELPARQTLQLVYDAEYVAGEVSLNTKEHHEYKWISIDELKQYDLINFLEDVFHLN